MNEDKTKLYLREATKEDVDILFEWVNDASVRKSAFSSEIIKYEDHCAWFDRVLNNKQTFQYILECEEQAVGQVRVDVKDEIGEVDYSIAPSHRLSGYGTHIISLLIDKIKTDDIGIVKLRAVVKSENIASKKVFLSNGFTSVCENFEIDVKDVRI